MTREAVSVLREALSLPDSDRATIAAELLASLGDPGSGPVVGSDEWVREIERRARAALSGADSSEDWSLVEQRILGRLSNG